MAIHTDAPYFWGATRFQLPQWLLVAMTHSGLFAERFVDQIQVVGYFHEWNATATRGRVLLCFVSCTRSLPRRARVAGEFVFWDRDSRQPNVMRPAPRAATIVDGSKVVHAASVYRGPPNAPPVAIIDRNKYCTLE